MIDISSDVGEGTPGEETVWPFLTSANVACGGHAGDETSMKDAVARSKQFGVKLGAHPSYPDREHFGRRTMAMPLAALAASLDEQIHRLRQLAAAAGVPLVHVKAHGALYNDAHRDPALARIIVAATQQAGPAVAIVCAHDSAMARAASEAGVPVIREAFADRRYRSDGSLVARTEDGSLLTVEETARQVSLLVAEGVVVAANGDRRALPFDTICVHADMPGVQERLRRIHACIDHENKDHENKGHENKGHENKGTQSTEKSGA